MHCAIAVGTADSSESRAAFGLAREREGLGRLKLFSGLLPARGVLASSTSGVGAIAIKLHEST